MTLVRRRVMMNILAGTFLFNVFICSVQRGSRDDIFTISMYGHSKTTHGDYEYPSR